MTYANTWKKGPSWFYMRKQLEHFSVQCTVIEEEREERKKHIHDAGE